MKFSNVYGTAVLLAGIGGSTQVFADVGTLLVPPGLESAEGGNSFASHDPPASGSRIQGLYLASEFSSLPDGRGVLVGLTWRPDRSVRGPGEFFCADAEIRLSTTEAESGRSLNRNFDRNIGADEALVYSGDLQLRTDGSGPPQGPREPDYAVEFEEPFLYDSSLGDLLVDWSCGPGSWGAPSFDAETTPGLCRLIWAWSPSALSAADERNADQVAQFQFLEDTPLQAGDADQDRDFDQLDLVHVLQAAKYLTGEPATWGEGDWDGAPGGTPGSPPPGNGLFDQIDIVAALAPAHYMAGPVAALNPAGAHDNGQTSVEYDAKSGELSADAPVDLVYVAVPEPSALVLMILGILALVVAARRA